MSGARRRPRAHAARSEPAPPSSRRAAVDALAAWLADPERRVGAEVERLTPALDARDRALAREVALGAVRRLRLLDYLLAALCERGMPTSPVLRAALYAGAFQLLFLDRVPPHAAVAETVGAIAAARRGFVNAVLRRLARALVPVAEAGDVSGADWLRCAGDRALRCAAPLPDPTAEPLAHAALCASLPDWLVRRWAARFGPEVARQLCVASIATPGVHLRAVGHDGAELCARLRDEGVAVEPEPASPRSVRWSGEPPSPLAGAAFRDGWFVVQDPTAAAAADALGVEAGDVVLDLCAAPGTKTALLAERAGPAGRVLAHDISAERMQRVQQNVARLRLANVELRTALGDLPPLDRVLVDVPCSNTGVLARRVEVRHRLDPGALLALGDLQRELLDRALGLVRPGGTVVYATCSIEHEENAGVVADVLAAHPGRAELLAERLTMPAPPQHDGGYHAILHRTVRAPG
ncbi:MAG: methyltransferase domain-containing protein [Planctomycetes bacterium]|nr:methyltransferase domain-containing protein [Planctomycetota bacterium]